VLHRDEEASRVHARFFLRGPHVFVEDLDSTNGTFVGGERVIEEKRLDPGDVVRVGSSLVTLGRYEPSASSSHRLAALAAMDNPQSPSSSDATRPADIFDLLERVARQAIEAEDAREAERVTSMHLERLLVEVREGTAEPAHVERAIAIAADLARVLPSARWLDYLVELHARLDRTLGDDLVELLCASSETSRISPARLRDYCRRLADRSSSLTVPERMATLRIQRLLPQLQGA
jgi:hypothetical protein